MVWTLKLDYEPPTQGAFLVPKGVYQRTQKQLDNLANRSQKNAVENGRRLSYALTGLVLTKEESAARKSKSTKEWIHSHPTQVKKYDQRYLERRALNNRNRRRQLRRDVIAKLGGKCSSKNCRWLNSDGSLGCTDERLLQLDHVNGGGTKERNKMGWEAMWKKALQDAIGLYQILCGNCNWLKAHEQGVFGIKYKGS